MTVDTSYESKPCGVITIADNFLISALAFFALSFFATSLNAATWTVKHLTGDEDSGVSSHSIYTCAVNVHGTEDKVVNGVTFKAESGTSGEGWAITQNFQTQHNGRTSSVRGKIGEVISNRMRFNGDPQKLKMTGLTPGETYVFALYNQAWDVGENRTAILSLDAAEETITVNQGVYGGKEQDGLLVECEYVANDTEVEFTIDPITNATWHLYGFSNSRYSSEPPVISPNGESYIRVPLDSDYSELGATATDAEDGDISNSITTTYFKPWVVPLPLKSDTYEGLQLWLKADAGVEDGTWADQSGNSRDATAKGSPTLVTAALNNLPLMRYSGTNGECHEFPELRDIRTVFWVVKRVSGPSFLLGDNDRYHFHSWDNVVFVSNHTHSHIKEGRLAFNGDVVDLLNSNVPRAMSVISLRTTGDVEASNFSNDRNIGGRYWKGDLGELLIYNTALSDEEIADVEMRLAVKWGLPFTKPIETTETLDTSILGSWTVAYEATDSTEIYVQAERQVQVFNPAAPVITLNGEANIHNELNTEFTDPGFTLADAAGTSLDASNVEVSGKVFPTLTGTYVLTYNFTDEEGRAAETRFRTVEVADTQPPVINLVGGSTIKHPLGQPFVEPGFSAEDIVDGDVAVLSSLYTLGIQHRGFLFGSGDHHLNFEENGGLLTRTPVGEKLLETALYFANDGEFMNAGVGINRSDSFNNLFTGMFTARVTGDYQFQMYQKDDRGTFWVDLNRNGLFEQNGSAGNEWMNNGYADGMSTVRLSPGNYRFAIGHTEHGGGSRVWARFSTPHPRAGPTSLTTIDPTDKNQAGLWVIESPLNTGGEAIHSITYTATDAAGNSTSVTRVVEVVAIDSQPVITLKGRAILQHEQYAEFVDPGFSVADPEGNELDASNVKVSGYFDITRAGTYELLYTFQDENQIPADPITRTVTVVDTQAPSITLVGEAEIEHEQGQEFVDPGATLDEDPEGELFVVSTAQLPSEGLWMHLDANRITDANLGDVLLRWTDVSGQGNHLSDVRGQPILAADAINGMPAVRVDGNDFLAATKDVQRRYSIFHVSRWSGNKAGRLISSRNVNWFMGYWNGHEDAFHPEGWVSSHTTKISSDPHLYAATSTGQNNSRFYGDGRDLTVDSNRNGRIGKIQVGGQGEASESSSGDVAEILIYNNHVVTDTEKLTIEAMLAVKYGLLGYPQEKLPDLTVPGEHTVHYLARDKTGNVGVASRKVTVKPDLSLPIITLNGDERIVHEATTTFEDPGATVKDGEGNELPADGLEISGTVDPNVLGLQLLTYNYTTAEGKVAATVTRNIIVEDSQGPEITLVGDAVVRLKVGGEYTEAGVTAEDLLDGELPVFTSSDLPKEGMVLHLDASSLKGLIGTGDPLDQAWPDLSGNGNHADNRSGDPQWIEDGLNGRPIVKFDGDDLIWTTKNFEPDLANYTLLSVARYTGGGNGRVISTRARNFIFGFHQGHVRKFHADGWASNGNFQDTKWHLHFGDVNDSDQANFWVDGVHYARNHGGLHNTNYKPDQIQLGGWLTNREMSKCAVAELILYDRVVSEEERNKLMDCLNYKYGLRGGGGFANVFVDTSKPGTYSIDYIVSDKSGNVSKSTRTVIVSEDDTRPYIALKGEVLPTIEAASIDSYEDPGASAVSAAGETLNDDLMGEGDVDVLNPGVYSLTYNFSDNGGNAAETVVRTVRVVDTLGPVITLTEENPLKVFVDAKFEDPGATSVDQRDGETVVYSDYLPIPDTLRLEYHNRPNSVELLYLQGEGGVLAHPPAVSGYFTDGIHGDGINFLNDQDFKDISGVNRNDGYQLVLSGLFDARRDGNYGFAASKHDGNDYCTIWVDKDQDGILEKNGDLGDEQVVWDNQISTVHLSRGKYRVVIAYSEWNGNSRFNARFSTPEGAGPFSLTNIHPGGSGQEGLWSSIPRVIDTSVPGQHTITYFADDKLGNRSTLDRTIIVEEDTQRPIIHLLGEKGLDHHVGFPYRDAGVLLDDYQGNPLDESQVKITGTPDGLNLGSYTILYEYTDPEGHVALPVTRTVIVKDIVAPIITLNGVNPATVQLNQKFVDPGAVAIDAFDGQLPAIHNLGFNKEGLVLHLDAGSFKGKLNNGEVIAIDWEDLSGNGNHADNQVGDPKWLESALNGQPVVDFNGNDIIWTTKDFEPDLAHYSIFSVARYSGNNRNRVISSRGRNWFFGFHGNTIRRFHSDGWAWNQGGADQNWHIHIGDVNDQDQANFWLDGTHLAKNSNGLDDTNYKPRNINLGGYNDSNERSNCQIAELLLFDRVLSAEDREYIELYLKSKYNLNGGGDLFFSPVDTTKAGEYTYTYKSTDAAGNIAEATRTVIVVDQPDLPVITLNGEVELIHPTGEAYEDAGATVADSQGTPLDADKIVVINTVNTDLPGEYIVSYDYAIDGGASAVTIIRTVKVVDQTAPVITLEGGDRIIHQLGNPFTDPGFSGVDLVDGSVHVESSLLMVNRARVRGYMQSSVDALLNLEADTSLLLAPVVGENTKYSGSFYIRADAAFRNIIPEITRNDSFQILIDGHFKTDGGRYEFGMEQPNDSAAFWLDLDGDGLFEFDGGKGSELMNPTWAFGYTEVDLHAGYHRYAIAFREGGGHSQMEARYRAIQGAGPGQLTAIHPSSPQQQRQWVVYNPIDVLAPGEHEITYTAADRAGNVGTVVRTVVVKNNPDAGIITLKGDPEMTVAYQSQFTDPGVTVTDLDGNDLSMDKLEVIGEVDTSKIGSYVLEYNYLASEGVPSRAVSRIVNVTDTVAPVITLQGDAELTVFKGTKFEDPGATASDNYDGDFVVVGSSQKFPQDGLVLHLDASTIGGKLEGDTVTLWYDQSSSKNHADTYMGTPTYASTAINGMPAVYFDGISTLSINHSIGTKYTILTVSSLADRPHGRLLTSRDQNWLLGYHGGNIDCFYPGNGWSAPKVVPSAPGGHLYSATSGDQFVRFFADGVDKTAISQRMNTSYSMGYFQMGGWGENIQECSAGYVSEVIIYDRILSDSERMGVEARLNSKYSLNGIEGTNAPVDTSVEGEYSIIYQSSDGFGNVANKVRKVTVVEDPNAPSITLNDEALIVYEASQSYTDAGAVLKDSAGNVLDTSLLEVENTVTPTVPGEYEVRYSYNPENGNPAPTVVRIVQVHDTLSPVITLSGPSTIKLEVGAEFVDPGASAEDAAAGITHTFSDLEFLPGHLLHQGFLEGNSDALLNLDNNGGILSATAVGSSLFTNGPGNRGLDFNNDGEFRAAIPEINRNDKYQNLISGALIVSKKGTYELGVIQQDDRVSIWLDLDQDGNFEAVGDKGNEQMRNAGQTGYGSVELDSGIYRVAFVHREGNGGSGMNIGISLPGVNRMNIHPSHPSQKGIWLGTSEATLDTSTPGIHTVTYSSIDAVGNIGMATRTVVVVADPSLPFIALNGEHTLEHEAGKAFTDSGALVTDADGNVLEANLEGQGTVDTNTPGEYSLTYDFTDGAGNSAVQVVRTVQVIDNALPLVTLKPHPSYGGSEVVKFFAGQPWEDPGVEVVDFDPEVTTVSSRDYRPHHLKHLGFMTNSHDGLLNFDGNGGLFDLDPVGLNNFTDGPYGRGFDFHRESDFRIGTGISRNDQFQTLVYGYFKAKVAGVYQFNTDNADDRITFWMDLDQDGVFETTGENGAERITWHNATGTRTLEPGYYRVAIGHNEGGGGARGRFRYQTPEGAGPSAELTVLNLTHADQYGLWFADGEGAIDTTYPGNHVITYFVYDSSGNMTTVKRSIVVEIDPDAPVITLLGDAEVSHDLGSEFNDPGVTIKDASGAELPADSLVLTITRDGESVDKVDGNAAGAYHIRYDYTDASNRKAIPVNRSVIVADTTPPVITLIGSASVQLPPGAVYEDSGATAVDALDGDVVVAVTSSSPAYGPMPGLLKGGLSGRNNTAENNGMYGVEPLGPSIENIVWQGNYTFVYSGQIYDADGVLSFREDIDDAVWLQVDGQQVLDDGGWNVVTTKSLELGRGGWFDFELRLHNAGGGAGQVTAPGFGWDAEGGANYIAPANTDPTAADLFRTHGPLVGTVTARSESIQTLTYTATDAAGNTATLVREIIIKDDPTLPILVLAGEAELIHEAGATFEEPGVTVEDSRGNALDASKIVKDGSVDVKKLGVYTISYNFTNDKGKAATPLKRRVEVVDTTAPVITLEGGTPLQVTVGQPFVDPGATITDNLDEGLTAKVTLKSSVAGLVANWNFNEGEGEQANDATSGLTGTLTQFDEPDRAWVNGKHGKAIQFDGVDDFIILPASEKLDLDEMTISAWVNCEDYAHNGFIFEKTTNGAVNTQYSLYFQQDQLIHRLVSGGNLQDLSISATINMDINKWNHVAATYDGSIRSLYVNGELIQSIAGAVTTNKNPNGTSIIGAFGSGADFFFKGIIDDIQIYNRAIPEEEIHNLQKPVGIDTTTKSVKPYELIYTVSDSSGNSATATREVIVSNDSSPPVITLEGDAVVTVDLNEVYEDLGATALDDQDGNLSFLIETNGTDEIDTSEPGEHTVTYDVTDFSGNAAVQVTRKVIVASSDPVDQWLSSKLPGKSAAEKALDADPDNDGIPNLLEYALSGDPLVADRNIILPVLETNSDNLSLTIVRLKPSKDASISLKAQVTTNLGATDGWSEDDVTIKGALQGVNQSDLPDEKPYATSDYERIKVEANTAKSAVAEGKQFLRITVEKQ